MYYTAGMLKHPEMTPAEKRVVTNMIAFRIPPELRTRLEQAAKDQDRPMTDILRDSLTFWLDEAGF